MSFLKAMQRRYTTKVYDPSASPISEEQIGELMEALRLSPSSINSQPWGIRLISDQATRERLAEHSRFNADKVRQASHLVVLCVYKDGETFAGERLGDMQEYAADYFRANIAPLGEEAVMSWLSRQVYIALGVLLSGAATMGIDSTTMEGIDTDAYTEALGLRDYRVLVAVALGKRSDEDYNQLSLSPKKRREDISAR